MLRLDVPVGLAVDGSASNDASNLMEEMRTAYLMHRLTYGAKAPSGYDLLKMATREARDSWDARNSDKSRRDMRPICSQFDMTALKCPARSATRRIYSAR